MGKHSERRRQAWKKKTTTQAKRSYKTRHLKGRRVLRRRRVRVCEEEEE